MKKIKKIILFLGAVSLVVFGKAGPDIIKKIMKETSIETVETEITENTENKEEGQRGEKDQNTVIEKSEKEKASSSK